MHKKSKSELPTANMRIIGFNSPVITTELCSKSKLILTYKNFKIKAMEVGEEVKKCSF